MILEIPSECLLFGINPDRFQTGLLQIDNNIGRSPILIVQVHIKLELSTGRMDPRVGSGRDGSGPRKVTRGQRCTKHTS